ncbi:kinase-like domain-containing protein [Rhizoctonia solani]|nr:kinase-like domain-containing protein [Rhizoctonia solani]
MPAFSYWTNIRAPRYATEWPTCTPTIHGDLKGDLIYVSEGGVPKIMLHIIFTHKVNDIHNSQSANALRWMAPELLKENKKSEQTFRSDVYALGMTILASSQQVPYSGMCDMAALRRAKTGQPPERSIGAIPGNEAGNVLWDLMCACWSYDPVERPKAAEISEIINALAVSQPFTQANQGSKSRMRFNPDTGVEEMVTFFTQNGIIDYTEELIRGDMEIKLHLPYLATAAARLYRADLSLKGGGQNTARTQKVVVKCVVSESPYKQLKRATRELYFWSGCKHRNILPLLGFAVLDGNLAIISPWVENGSVIEYLKKQYNHSHHDLCTQLTRAIAYLHEHGMIHGDIKGDNILVSDNGVVQVTDFGVSIVAQLKIEFTYTAKGRGTERWQAPEILRGITDSTKEGDVYAMGMTMVEIYTHQRPYDSIEMGHDTKCAIISGTLRPGRPWRLGLKNRGNAVWSLVQQCWEGSPESRPTSTEVYEQLQRMGNPVEGTAEDYAVCGYLNRLEMGL